LLTRYTAVAGWSGIGRQPSQVLPPVAQAPTVAATAKAHAKRHIVIGPYRIVDRAPVAQGGRRRPILFRPLTVPAGLENRPHGQEQSDGC
jgi:hypothetical protein